MEKKCENEKREKAKQLNFTNNKSRKKYYTFTFFRKFENFQNNKKIIRSAQRTCQVPVKAQAQTPLPGRVKMSNLTEKMIFISLIT